MLDRYCEMDTAWYFGGMLSTFVRRQSVWRRTGEDEIRDIMESRSQTSMTPCRYPGFCSSGDVLYFKSEQLWLLGGWAKGDRAPGS